MVGVEGPNNFELSSSTLLEKALKALPSHFKFDQSFVSFLIFNFWGAPDFGHQNIHPTNIEIRKCLLKHLSNVQY